MTAFATMGCNRAPTPIAPQPTALVPVEPTPVVTPAQTPAPAPARWTPDPVITREFTQIAKIGVYQIQLSPKLVEKEIAGRFRDNTLLSIFKGNLSATDDGSILVVSISTEARMAASLQGPTADHTVESYLRSLVFSLDFQLGHVSELQEGKLGNLRFLRKGWRAIDPDRGPLAGISYVGSDGDSVIYMSLFTRESDEASLRLLDQMVATFKKSY